MREPRASSLAHRPGFTDSDVLFTDSFVHTFAITRIWIRWVVDSQDIVRGIGVYPVAVFFVKLALFFTESVHIRFVFMILVSMESAITAFSLSHTSHELIESLILSSVHKSRKIECSTFFWVVGR
jgi:hypothetical protein